MERGKGKGPSIYFILMSNPVTEEWRPGHIQFAIVITAG